MEELLINSIFNLFSGILSAILVAVVTWIFLEGNLNRLTVASKLRKHGVSSIQFTVPSMRDRKKVFNKAARIRIIYTSGKGFFLENKTNQKLIEKANKRGATIQILLASKNTEFIHEIEDVEIEAGTREQEATITKELNAVERYLNGFSNVKVRHFNTEYRMPMMIADYDYDSENDIYRKSEGWLYIYFLPHWSHDAVILKGQMKNPENSSSNNYELDNLVEMMHTHFQAIWDRHPPQPPKNKVSQSGK